MGIGNVITLVVLDAFAIFAIYFTWKARREAKQIALSKKHGPPTGVPELDRAKHINNGGLGSGGNIGR